MVVAASPCGPPSAWRKRPPVTHRPPDQTTARAAPPSADRKVPAPIAWTPENRTNDSAGWPLGPLPSSSPAGPSAPVSSRKASARSPSTNTASPSRAPRSAIPPPSRISRSVPSASSVAPRPRAISAEVPEDAGTRRRPTPSSTKLPDTTVSPAAGWLPAGGENRSTGSWPGAARRVSRRPTMTQGSSSRTPLKAHSTTSPSSATPIAAASEATSPRPDGPSTIRQIRRGVATRSPSGFPASPPPPSTASGKVAVSLHLRIFGSPHSPAIVASSATTGRIQGQDEPAGRGRTRSEPRARSTSRSMPSMAAIATRSTTSCAGVWYRSRGSFCRSRSTTASRPSGMSSRSAATGGGGLCWCWRSF